MWKTSHRSESANLNLYVVSVQCVFRNWNSVFLMQGNEGEGSSMSCERYNHLCDLMRMGNKAFRDSKLDKVKFSTLICFILCSGVH